MKFSLSSRIITLLICGMSLFFGVKTYFDEPFWAMENLFVGGVLFGQWTLMGKAKK